MLGRKKIAWLDIPGCGLYLQPAWITDESQSLPCKTVLAAPGPDVVATWVTPEMSSMMKNYSVAVGTTNRNSVSIVFEFAPLALPGW
jgi:hypothetical protein